jgi:NAD(P)H-dependent FMN reductase
VGKVVGLIATAAVAHHALAVDHALRPLVASLGGLSAARAIYATDETFPSAVAVPDEVGRAVKELADELIRLG